MKMYRYVIEPHRRWIGDESTELVGVGLTLLAYRVRRTTPCGVWIYDGRTHRERWCSLTARKCFAYDTTEKALTSYRARTRRRRWFLKSALIEVELALLAAETDELYVPVPGFDAAVSCA